MCSSRFRAGSATLGSIHARLAQKLRSRRIPAELYDAVLDLTAAIAQPDVSNESDIDAVSAEEAQRRLIALFQSREAAGAPDPFLTEALADFTDDDAESIRLYRLALEQCTAFPGEPTHTKRQGLIERLIELGRDAEAREELACATREAFADRDAVMIKELGALAQKLAD